MSAGVTKFTLTAVLIDAIFALGTIAAGVTETLVDVVLTVDSGSTIGTITFVAVDKVLACSLVLTWGGAAFINFSLTQKAGVSRMTHAVERVVPVDAFSLSAR